MEEPAIKNIVPTLQALSFDQSILQVHISDLMPQSHIPKISFYYLGFTDHAALKVYSNMCCSCINYTNFTRDLCET